MKGIHADPGERTVRVEGGCAWLDVDHATHAFGMATPSGTVASTGVAGLTLGGGIGHLTRKYGLTVDNLLSVDMISADGRHIVRPVSGRTRTSSGRSAAAAATSESSRRSSSGSTPFTP